MDSPTAVWETQDAYSSGHGWEAACLKRTNWGELCSFASELNDGVPCAILPHVSVGGSSMARILQFDNEAKTRWIARIWMPDIHQSKFKDEDLFENEVNAMTVINDQLKDRSPVPKVFGYNLDPMNPTGSRFILMEYIRGIIAMDLDGGWDAHRDVVPQEHKPKFYKSFARAHALCASARLPKIGCIIREEDGTISVGPLPPFGGPFDTAVDFFKAWAELTCRLMVDRGYRDKIMRHPDNTRDHAKSMIRFPYALASIAERLSSSPYNKGPFPIIHPALDISNIITDLNYNVLGVIDWEYATAVPWEMFRLPDFFHYSPPAFKYDEGSSAQEIDGYIAMVAEAEKAENLDAKLSGILGNRKILDLGFAVKTFGKGPRYANDFMAILEPFKDPVHPFASAPEVGDNNELWSILKDTILGGD